MPARLIGAHGPKSDRQDFVKSSWLTRTFVLYSVGVATARRQRARFAPARACRTTVGLAPNHPPARLPRLRRAAVRRRGVGQNPVCYDKRLPTTMAAPDAGGWPQAAGIRSSVALARPPTATRGIGARGAKARRNHQETDGSHILSTSSQVSNVEPDWPHKQRVVVRLLPDRPDPRAGEVLPGKRCAAAEKVRRGEGQGAVSGTLGQFVTAT